jgi:hypothetical protein
MDTYLVSESFLRIDILFSLIFAISTMFVSIFAHKLYKLTEQKHLKLFSLAFLSFSLTYIIQSILSLVLQFQISDHIDRFGRLHIPFTFKLISIYAHVILFMIGLILLTYMTLKTNNSRVLALLLSLTIVPIILTPTALSTFHILSSILLLFIILFYYNNYRKYSDIKTGLPLLAFIFLFIGHIQFVIALHYGLFFIIGRILELIAYICILITLILLNKK